MTEPIKDTRVSHARQRLRVVGAASMSATGQSHDEEQLRRFRATMDSSGDEIYLTDRATVRFLDVNKTACRMTGYMREELLQMGPHDI